MEQISARAALVPASDLGDGLTTTIPRSEIQDVLAAEEEPIELVLDITRSSNGEAGEMRNVSVTWERSDLERLLNEAEGDQIALTFDLDALRRATDPSEVEAHGLRETAMILAVAATAAAGGAQAASAEPGPMLGGQAAPITQSAEPAGPTIPYLSHGEGVTAAELGTTGVAPDDRAVARVDAPAMSPDDRAVARTDPAAEPAGPQIPYLSHGEGVTSAELGIGTGTAPDDRAVARVDAPSLSPDDRAVPRTDPAVEPTPTGPQVPYLSQGEGVTSAELGIGTGVTPDDRAFPRTDPGPTTGGTASDPGTFSVPGPETVVVAGVIALAITGAFFIVGGRRRERPRPA
jgi:hypothetical protein